MTNKPNDQSTLSIALFAQLRKQLPALVTPSETAVVAARLCSLSKRIRTRLERPDLTAFTGDDGKYT